MEHLNRRWEFDEFLSLSECVFLCARRQRVQCTPHRRTLSYFSSHYRRTYTETLKVFMFALHSTYERITNETPAPPRIAHSSNVEWRCCRSVNGINRLGIITCFSILFMRIASSTSGNWYEILGKWIPEQFTHVLAKMASCTHCSIYVSPVFVRLFVCRDLVCTFFERIFRSSNVCVRVFAAPDSSSTIAIIMRVTHTHAPTAHTHTGIDTDNLTAKMEKNEKKSICAMNDFESDDCFGNYFSLLSVNCKTIHVYQQIVNKLYRAGMLSMCMARGGTAAALVAISIQLFPVHLALWCEQLFLFFHLHSGCRPVLLPLSR